MNGSARGFTLLEVIVAMSIVGLASVSALGAVSAAASSAELTAAALTANELAEERTASLLTLLPSALADSADDLQRPVDGMPGWSWSATIDAGAAREGDPRWKRAAPTVVLRVRVVGPNAEAYLAALRPAPESTR